MDKLKELYEWFDENRLRIIENHFDEFALLKENKVIGYFGSLNEALVEAGQNGWVVGEYLIQECIPAELEYAACYSACCKTSVLQQQP